jgi:Rieske Fe-S protein
MSDPSGPIDLGRRRLCQAMCAGAGMVVVQTVTGCGEENGQMANCAATAIGVGDAATLAVGQARWIESIKVFVCHDSGGYYAMDSQCTHIGTDIKFVDEASGFKCPLHMSTFTFNGKVTMGPATVDLPHYSLCATESGLLVVDTTKKVTADTRLIV